jgi:hypothetical protein
VTFDLSAIRKSGEGILGRGQFMEKPWGRTQTGLIEEQ